MDYFSFKLEKKVDIPTANRKDAMMMIYGLQFCVSLGIHRYYNMYVCNIFKK